MYQLFICLTSQKYKERGCYMLCLCVYVLRVHVVWGVGVGLLLLLFVCVLDGKGAGWFLVEL